MAVWLVVLVLTNLATLGALIALAARRGRADSGAGAGEVDEVFSAPRPAGVTGRSRRLITIEVLNPIELVGTRGRVAGIAGSLAPGIARRLVNDQLLRTLRRELADKQVVADVRLHQLRPLERSTLAADVVPAVVPEPEDVQPVESPAAVDEVTRIDLDEV